MDSEQQKHFNALPQTYLRRLRVQELKAAQLGTQTPPDVILEIDDLRKKIEEIEAQLSPAINLIAEQSSNTATATKERSISVSQDHPVQSVQQVEIVIKGDYANLTPQVQEAYIKAIAAMLSITPDLVIVLRVSGGSIVFRLEIPSEAAELLLRLYQENDPIIKELEIQTVRISSGRWGSALEKPASDSEDEKPREREAGG